MARVFGCTATYFGVSSAGYFESHYGIDALTDAQFAHLIPKNRCAAATLGTRIPTTG